MKVYEGEVREGGKEGMNGWRGGKGGREKVAEGNGRTCDRW